MPNGEAPASFPVFLRARKSPEPLKESLLPQRTQPRTCVLLARKSIPACLSNVSSTYFPRFVFRPLDSAVRPRGFFAEVRTFGPAADFARFPGLKITSHPAANFSVEPVWTV
jgi:hypothetical protein